MPEFADVELQDVEDALYVLAVRTAIKMRQMRGAVWAEVRIANQQRCLEVIEELLPDFGCISLGMEYEGSFTDVDACVTFSSIGEKSAFSRGLSYGCATAVSLVVNGTVRAVYVADINNGDVFGFGPVTHQVTHWRDFGYETEGQALDVDYSLGLSKQTVLLRGERENYGDGLTAIARSVTQGGLFRAYESISGLDTVWTMLSLIRGHTGALVLPKNTPWMPWYDAPMMGLAQACGFVYLQEDCEGNKLHELDLRPPLETLSRSSSLVIVHEAHADTVKTGYAERCAR